LIQLKRNLSVFPNILRAFRLVWGSSRLHSAMISGFTVLGGVLPLAQVWLSKLIVDSVVQAIRNGGFSKESLVFLLLQFCLWIVQRAIEATENSVRTLLGDRLVYHINVLTTEKAASLPLAIYEVPTFYDKLDNARREANWRPLQTVSAIFSLTQGIIILISMASVLVRLHLLVLIAIIVLAVPHAWAQIYYGRKRYRLRTLQSSLLRKILYLSGILASRNTAKETRIFGLKNYFLGRYREAYFQFLRQNKRLYISQGVTTILLGLISAVSLAGAYTYIVLQAIARRITLGDLTMFFQAASRCQSTIAGVFSNISTLYENNLFLTNLFTFLDMEIEEGSGSYTHKRTTPRRKVPKPLRRGIEVQNVSFRYPATERMVLQNINLVIRPGETVAIVGENGAGKTTLVKLLAALYEPTEGRILLDGYDLGEYDREDYYRNIGIIFQDFAKYQLTVRENIGLGQVEYVNDLVKVKEAADKGGAVYIVEKLADKYETILGRFFKGGVDLSVGEWQKIALSRAFMRELDAQILILDEPTASLDAIAEYDIYKRFKELTRGKIVILISHRFSTVRMADHIIVMEGGRIIEEGDHEELMNLNGKYARMFTLQAQRYT